MALKIIVSDVETTHANNCKNHILAICPTATVDVRIESFAASVDYAIANGYHGISRSTTGLSDYRIETAAKEAYDAGIFTCHAHGSNAEIYLDNPTYIGEAIAVSANEASYGPGAEIKANDGTESYGTAKTAGMMAQILTDNPT